MTRALLRRIAVWRASDNCYTHQNGIVDDSSFHYFPATKITDEYQMMMDEFLKCFEYLAESADDKRATFSSVHSPPRVLALVIS